ncbi:hypothetical protein T4B_10285 [Trichinella pseudospiralis]|uniref:Transmembrane protein n=1 Tax=Trichinella pseudospiralis TaxID=6337 RepID=A0A0V1J545_TRIPS|nr:hypothetical protein T4B_10285 [Trichinella pseudospiralis]
MQSKLTNQINFETTNALPSTVVVAVENIDMSMFKQPMYSECRKAGGSNSNCLPCSRRSLQSVMLLLLLLLVMVVVLFALFQEEANKPTATLDVNHSS